MVFEDISEKTSVHTLLSQMPNYLHLDFKDLRVELVRKIQYWWNRPTILPWLYMEISLKVTKVGVHEIHQMEDMDLLYTLSEFCVVISHTYATLLCQKHPLSSHCKYLNPNHLWNIYVNTFMFCKLLYIFQVWPDLFKGWLFMEQSPGLCNAQWSI